MREMYLYLSNGGISEMNVKSGFQIPGDLPDNQNFENTNIGIEKNERVCRKCGSVLSEGQKFCMHCGCPVNDVGSAVEKKKRRWIWLLCTGILVIGVGCLLLFFFIGSKSDMDKMVGTWRETDGGRGFRFYESYEKDGNYGEAEYMKSDSVYYGTYEWRESSKRIVITVTDNWGALDSMSFDYEIVDSDHIILRRTTEPDKAMYLEKD